MHEGKPALPAWQTTWPPSGRPLRCDWGRQPSWPCGVARGALRGCPSANWEGAFASQRTTR
eukprot:13802819-Alexandrium_andersonii.AAC.1